LIVSVPSRGTVLGVTEREELCDVVAGLPLVVAWQQ